MPKFVEVPMQDWLDTVAERDRLREAMKGAAIIADSAGRTIKELLAELQAGLPRMEAFIRTISRLNHDGEEREGLPPFVMENDDAVDTLNSLIQQAREIVASLRKL